MNLFRSEEHTRRWSQFDPTTVEGILPLDTLAELFSVDHFTRRLEPDYVSTGLHAESLLAALRDLATTLPFWSPDPR